LAPQVEEVQAKGQLARGLARGLAQAVPPQGRKAKVQQSQRKGAFVILLAQPERALLAS